MWRGPREPRQPDGLSGTKSRALAEHHRSILHEAPFEDEEERRFQEVSASSSKDGEGGSFDERGCRRDSANCEADESRKFKIESGSLGNRRD